MKIKLTLSQNHYLIIETKKANRNNFNKWAFVYENGSQTPATGTSFMDGTPDLTVVMWAADALNTIPKQSSLF